MRMFELPLIGMSERRGDWSDGPWGSAAFGDSSVGAVAHCQQLPSAAGWQSGRYRPRIDIVAEGAQLIVDDDGPADGRVGGPEGWAVPGNPADVI